MALMVMVLMVMALMVMALIVMALRVLALMVMTLRLLTLMEMALMVTVLIVTAPQNNRALEARCGKFALVLPSDNNGNSNAAPIESWRQMRGSFVELPWPDRRPARAFVSRLCFCSPSCLLGW